MPDDLVRQGHAKRLQRLQSVAENPHPRLAVSQPIRTRIQALRAVAGRRVLNRVHDFNRHAIEFSLRLRHFAVNGRLRKLIACGGFPSGGGVAEQFDFAVRAFARLDGVEELAERRADDRHFARGRVRIRAIKLEPKFFHCRPSVLVNDVRQVIVRRILILQLRNQIRLERARRHFSASGPIFLRSLRVELGRSRLERSVLDGADDGTERFHHSLAHLGVFNESRSARRKRHVQRFGRILRLAARSLEVVVERMPPLVTERASAVFLGQVDDHLARLVMRSGRLDAARSARTERNAKLPIQGNRFRRNPKDSGHVHQRIERLVKIVLTLRLFDPIPEFNPLEPERIAEHLWRHILPVAHVFANARFVGVSPLVRNFLRGFELCDQGGIVGITIRTRLAHRRERASKVNMVAPDFLADQITDNTAIRVNVERCNLGLFRVQLQRCDLFLERLQRLFLGVAGRQFARPVAECGCNSGFLDHPQMHIVATHVHRVMMLF